MRAAATISTAWCLLFFAATLPVQVTAAADGTTSTGPKVGHVRLWNMVFLNANGLDLVIGAGPAAKVVQSAPTGNYSAPYDVLPPGHYTLNVFHAGDRQTPLKSFNVSLVDKSYFTILALSLPGSQPSIELIDDTPDPAKPPSNRLTVRQTCFIAHAVVVNVSNQHTDPMEPGAVQTLEGLPDGLVSIASRATTQKGAKNWNGEADFRTSRHATLFVVGDSYGRLRLRTASDGPSPAEEAEAAAEARNKP